METGHFSNTKYALDRIERKREISELYKIPIDEIYDLSSGDNLFISPTLIQDIIFKQILSIDPRDSYPFNYDSLITEIALFSGVDPSSIYIGTTHNLLIQRVVSTYTKPNDKILILCPDKEIYSLIANKFHLTIERIPLVENFSFDLEGIFQKIKKIKPKIMVLSSPNFPTANQFEREKLLKIVRETSMHLVIDESYVEFGDYSFLKEVKNFDNLTVVRTFSKAWGLGSFACAYLIGNDKLVEKLKFEYFIEEIPPISLLVTKYTLQNPYIFLNAIEHFIEEKKRVIENIKILNRVKVYTSHTNFLLIKFNGDINELYDFMCSKGIIVRTFCKEKHCKKLSESFLVTLADNKLNKKLVLSLVEALETLP